MILAPLAPGASEIVRNALETFLDNANRLGAMGVIGIAVTSILMLNTIESTLNGIWRVVLRRPLGLKLDRVLGAFDTAAAFDRGQLVSPQLLL